MSSIYADCAAVAQGAFKTIVYKCNSMCTLDKSLVICSALIVVLFVARTMSASPIENFRWSMKKMRASFKLGAADIFKPNYHHGIAVYVILIYLFAVPMCYLYSAFDENLDMSVRFTAASLIFGVSQVQSFGII